VPYTLVYHPQADEQDVPLLPLNVQHRIARAIAARLVTAPEQYGAPLKGTLKGYWKLRVGDYRIVYKIVKHEVWILGILHRKQVYKEILRREAWHPL
jgi:mRNA interferase RelE/StbE